MPRAQPADLVVVARGGEQEAVFLDLVVVERHAVLQHGRRHFVGRIATAQALAADDAVRRMQPAFALELRLVRFPGVRHALVQQHGAVLEVALAEVILDLLVRRDAVADDAAQVVTIAAGLVHPRHVADREIRIQAKPSSSPRAVAHAHRPQLGHVVDRQHHAHLHLEAIAAHPPRDIRQAHGEGECLGRAAHRFVRHGEQRAILLVLDVAEATGVVCVVRLFRLHEGFGLQRRRMRVLGRFRLHELRGGEAPAIELQQHLPVPQERRRGRHRRGTGQHEAATLFLETVGYVRHADASRRACRSAWMRASAASSSG